MAGAFHRGGDTGLEGVEEPRGGVTGPVPLASFRRSGVAGGTVARGLQEGAPGRSGLAVAPLVEAIADVVVWREWQGEYAARVT